MDPQYGNLGAKVFFIWGGACFSCIAFAYFFVPETRGLTLEQVDKMMEQVGPPQSSKWVPTETFVQEMGYEKTEDVLDYSVRNSRVLKTPLRHETDQGHFI